MGFPKFSEWVSLREEAAPQAAPKNALAGMVGSKPKKPSDPRTVQAVANSLKKNKGKVNPNEIIDAVAKTTGNADDVIDVAKKVGEGN